MGLDATTYVLEILNFLVLLWLLRRYLFQPLLKVIRQRQQQAEDALHQQQEAQNQLALERQKLAQEHAAWQAERSRAEQQLTEEMAQERRQRLAALEADLAKERAQAHVRLAHLAEQQASEQQRQSADQALQFLSQYMQRLAGPELEQAIIRLFLEDLQQLDDATRTMLLTQAQADEHNICINTAYPIAPEQRQQLEQQLRYSLPTERPYLWREDPRLKAGICLELDGHLLEASLAAGLDAFRTLQPEAT